MSAALAPVLAVSALVAAAAGASGKPTLTVLAVSLRAEPDPRTVASLQAHLEEGIIANGDRFRSVDLEAHFNGEAASAAVASKRKAEAAFAAGRQAFDQLDLDRAGQLFLEASELCRAAGLRTTFAAYIGARLWHAASRYLNGDKPGAQEEFAKVFAVDPQAPVDRSVFPPDLVAMAERSRAAALSDRSLTLSVIAEPAALASVDGQAPQASPAIFAHLPPGEHLVVVTAPGYQPAALTTAEPQVHVSLTPSAHSEEVDSVRAEVSRAFLASDRTGRLAVVARSLGVDQLLVVGFDKRAKLIRILRADSEGRPLAAAEGNEGARPVDELERLLPGVLSLDALPAGQAAFLASERRTGYGQGGGVDVPKLAPWFGLGALVLTGGAVGFGLAAANDVRHYQKVPQVDTSDSNRWSIAENENAIVADVFGGAAIAVALTAASFWLVPQLWGWHPPPPAAAPTPPGAAEPEESLRLSPVIGPGFAGLSAAARW